MSGLQPVSFAKGRERAPRLSKPYVPGRHSERFFSEAEDDVIRRHFPAGGAPACLPHLPPHRTPTSVYSRAKRLGVKREKVTGQRRRHRVEVPADMDDRIRAAWPERGTRRGAMNRLADELDVPRWWLSKRALKLGLTTARGKEPNWTEAENALMRKVPLHEPETAARIFREHGFTRTATAIVVRAKKLDLSRRATRPTLSANQAAKIIGVDTKTMSSWCIAGEIEAVRRGTRRLPQQGGDAWDIRREDLRRFVIDQIERIDIRKVDKFAFVDLLVAGPGPGPSAGATE